MKIPEIRSFLKMEETKSTTETKLNESKLAEELADKIDSIDEKKATKANKKINKLNEKEYLQ